MIKYNSEVLLVYFTVSVFAHLHTPADKEKHWLCFGVMFQSAAISAGQVMHRGFITTVFAEKNICLLRLETRLMKEEVRARTNYKRVFSHHT